MMGFWNWKESFLLSNMYRYRFWNTLEMDNGLVLGDEIIHVTSGATSTVLDRRLRSATTYVKSKYSLGSGSTSGSHSNLVPEVIGGRIANIAYSKH